MDSEEISLNYNEITWLCSRGNREGLVAALQQYVQQHEFAQTDETAWAFERVQSFLSHGWSKIKTHFDIREDQDISEREIEEMLHLLFDGQSVMVGCQYVFYGAGGMGAALLLFCATEPPHEHVMTGR
jgi:hypothetical protein